MDMVKYCEQTVEAYYAVPGAPKLKPKVQQPWYEPTMEEIVSVANNPVPGVFHSVAASLLMKAPYMARMVRLDISFTTSFYPSMLPNGIPYVTNSYVIYFLLGKHCKCLPCCYRRQTRHW